MPNVQEGYFLIADITGYTGYLSQSELDHAQGILTTLLELLLQHTRPPLIVSRLAGDAVISYGLRDQFFQAQTFIEVIEDTYVAFRRAIHLMVLNNTCQCKACANLSSLDLKFFVHYGAFGLQHISDHDELVGSDVNLIHRLLKNHVTEQTGMQAYTLYTDSALRRLGIEGLNAGMLEHSEAYEHLGDVKVWLQNMHPIWEQKSATSHIVIPPERILMQFETEIALAPEIVWDYLIQPEYRNILAGSDQQVISNRVKGRIAPGSTIQCYHGKQVVPQTILEWQPFERIVTQDLVPVPIFTVTLLDEFRLTPTAGGTRLTQVLTKSAGPLPGRMMTDRMVLSMAKKGRWDMESFKKRIEADSNKARLFNIKSSMVGI